jgi:hypothetical protein
MCFEKIIIIYILCQIFQNDYNLKCTNSAITTTKASVYNIQTSATKRSTSIQNRIPNVTGEWLTFI